MADEFARTTSTRPSAISAGDGEDPSVPHPLYDIEQARRDRCRMLWEGTEAVREAGTDALPQYEGEEDPVYETRRDLAAVHPAFGETIEVSVGLLLTQPPTLGPNVPAPLVEFWDDVDGRGNAGPVFCVDLATDGLLDGKVGIFTDMPKISDRKGLDADAARRAGIRPWWIEVSADDVLMELYDVVNGAERLVLFIRREIAQERVGSFGLTAIYKYHVYEDNGTTVTARTYTASDASTRPQLEAESAVSLEKQTEIPWAPLEGGRRMKDGSISPPLHELAFLVLEHHLIKTGRLSLACLGFAPTMVVINAPKNADGTDPDVQTGPRSVIHARFAPGETVPPQPVYYTSPDVSVLAPAKDMLENVEAAMTVAGRGFLSPDKRGAETAKSKQLSNRAGNASLSRFAGRMEDALWRALGHASAYMGLPAPKPGSIVVSRRFEEALMEPEVMNAYAKLLELGLPVRLAFQALKLQGRIPADADEDELVMEWEVGLLAAKEARRVDAIPTDDDTADDDLDPPDPAPTRPRRFAFERDPDGRAIAITEAT